MRNFRSFKEFLFESNYGGDNAGNTAMHSTTLYHITDTIDFKLKTKYAPQNNTTLGGTMGPGIFLSRDVEHWVNGYGYWRPWVVEIEVPHNIRELSGVMGKGYGGELMVPSMHYDKLRIVRVIPLDAWSREEFGEYGWTEEWSGKTFDDQPLEVGKNFRGWRFEGDARDWTRDEQKKYEKRVHAFRKTRKNAIAN